MLIKCFIYIYFSADNIISKTTTTNKKIDDENQINSPKNKVCK